MPAGLLEKNGEGKSGREDWRRGVEVRSGGEEWMSDGVKEGKSGAKGVEVQTSGGEDERRSGGD